MVNATIESLLYDKGMASQPSARLLLGGCSSGGIGAMFNLDLVQSHLPANVELKGMLDAASWVDVTPLEQTGPTLQEMTQNMYNLLQPELGACGGVYSGTEGWKCLWPSFRLPMLRTPFFLNSFQFGARNNALLSLCCGCARASHHSRSRSPRFPSDSPDWKH